MSNPKLCRECTKQIEDVYKSLIQKFSQHYQGYLTCTGMQKREFHKKRCTKLRTQIKLLAFVLQNKVKVDRLLEDIVEQKKYALIVYQFDEMHEKHVIKERDLWTKRSD